MSGTLTLHTYPSYIPYNTENNYYSHYCNDDDDDDKNNLLKRAKIIYNSTWFENFSELFQNKIFYVALNILYKNID